jgi:hypothetical protein
VTIQGDATNLAGVIGTSDQVSVLDLSEAPPQLTTDESYSLTVSASGVSTIKAQTIYGALHAMETWSQLVVSTAQPFPVRYAVYPWMNGHMNPFTPFYRGNTASTDEAFYRGNTPVRIVVHRDSPPCKTHTAYIYIVMSYLTGRGAVFLHNVIFTTHSKPEAPAARKWDPSVPGAHPAGSCHPSL